MKHDLPARISYLRKEVDLVRSIPAGKTLRDKASTLASYLKAQGESKEIVDGVTEIKIRVERKLGELIPIQFPKGAKPGDGRQKGLKSPEVTLKKAKVSQRQSVTWQKLARIPEDKFEEQLEVFKADPESELTTTAIIHSAAGAHVGHNSGQNEWYTPSNIIESARSVMGSIDLDPASCEVANETVKAKRFHSIQNSGLSSPWHGNVWLNPPYSQPHIAQFMAKLAKELNSGKVKQACVLVNNATDTEWFHTLASCSSAICFTKGRVRFIDENGKPSGAPLQGQAIAYCGGAVKCFIKSFLEFGFVLLCN